MVKAEQIVTDRKTLKELVEFMEEAVRQGLSKQEIESQIDLLLDRDAKKAAEAESEGPEDRTIQTLHPTERTDRGSPSPGLKRFAPLGSAGHKHILAKP